MKNNKTATVIAALSVIALLLLTHCATIPKKTSAVTDFNADDYLGKWHEIARFDFKFEKNLNNVTAEYSLNNDGTIKVFNKGYNYVTGKWKSATGKAKFRSNRTTAALKVSFWKPFYSGYNVIAIDPGYQYALVAGKNLNYLWILSRNTTIPDQIKEAYLKKAESIGYDTSRLIWVEHNRTNK